AQFIERAQGGSRQRASQEISEGRGSAAVSPEVMNREERVVRLLIARERKGAGPQFDLRQRLEALGELPPDHFFGVLAIGPREIRQTAMEADFLKGRGAAQALYKGSAVPERGGGFAAAGDFDRPAGGQAGHAPVARTDASRERQAAHHEPGGANAGVLQAF